ncbi:MAG: hypothetical protein H6619_03015 [Deltaproteobacteria bacterium]|nr:hypothetical protein [Deltaproteobacteria bacterium]
MANVSATQKNWVIALKLLAKAESAARVSVPESDIELSLTGMLITIFVDGDEVGSYELRRSGIMHDAMLWQDGERLPQRLYGPVIELQQIAQRPSPLATA